MTYRANKKARKLWSKQALAAKERKRLDSESEPEPLIDIDPYIKITIERRATNEIAVFECTEGSRIDNYSVTCNGVFQGIQSMSTLTKNIRKSLPRFRVMN